MFVVPNHLTEQIGFDFMKLYPNANILVAKPDDFSPQKRRQMCARIATGNFDAVIIGHSQLIKIPLSAKREQEFIQNQINEITESITATKNAGGANYTIKELEKARAALKERFDKLVNSTVKDSTVTFEELGIDKMFVDEAQEFKNLFIATKMENVSGLATNPDTQKTQDLYMKCQYLDEKTNSKCVVFATGTPVETGYLRSQMPILRYFYYLFLKLPWAAPVSLLKSLGEIAVVVKAAKAADGVYGVGGVLYHVSRIAQAVIFQILKRGLTRYVPEAPEHLAFTDECGGCHVIKSDLFGVMVVDKKQYVTEPCLLGNAGGRVRRHILFRQMDKYPEKLGKLVADDKLVIGHSDIFRVPDVCEQPQYL